MACSTHLLVKILRIARMDDTERISKGILVFRQDNKMDVVLHEAVCEYGEAVFSAVIGNEEEVLSSVSVVFKYILPVIASLSDVMRIIRND